MKIEKYIIKVENAWRVRIRFNYEYIDKTKQFNFDKHGGEKEALKKAIKYRDGLLKKHNLLDRLNYNKSPDFLKSNNNNPCIGKYFNVRHQSNGLVGYWIARYQIDHKQGKKAFSVNVHGYEGAFLKACKIRYEWCGKIRVINKELLPCKPNVPFIINS